MKRFLSLVLAIVLVASSFTITCKAAQVNEYSNSSYDADAYYETAYTLYDGFMTGPCWAGYLADKKNFVYPQVKDKLVDDGYFQACLSAAEFLTNAGWADLFKGEYDADDVKVQYYVTALCGLLMTMEDNWESIRASQSKVDAIMTWNEYASEGASAVAGLLAENTNGIWETAFTVCGISVDIIGNAIDTVEDYQSLEAGATTFLMYHTLLETIINNTSDKIMSQAAQHLLKVTDLCYTYRMNYLDTTINAESDYFFSVLDKVLEDAEKSGALSLEEFAALGCMNKAAELGGSFKVGIDIGKFVMDVLIHSSDTILRYYEMCAMASVRDALIIEITKRNSGILGQQDWEEILIVRDLLMDLLYVNVRGEYCAYNLLAKDAGLISAIHNIFNGKKDIDWIRGILNIADNLQRTIKGFFPDWDNFKYDDVDSSNLVSEAYSVKGTYITNVYNSKSGKYENQTITASYCIPKINLPGKMMEVVNSEIYDALYPITQNSIQEISEYEYPFTSAGISYRWSMNKDVLSLVICNDRYPDSSGGYEYMVYNVSIADGIILSKDEVVSKAGLSKSEYIEMVKLNLGSRYWMSWSRANENFDNLSFVEFYNSHLKSTISQTNIDESCPYMDKEGNLCVIAKIYSLAAADYYWHDLNLVEHSDWNDVYYDLMPDYANPVEKQTHEQKISEDDAYQIACKYWDYTPGDVDEETGFELSVSPPSLNTDENTGKSYYYVMLRWWVEDSNFPHASTVDWVYIDAETGECSFDTP